MFQKTFDMFDMDRSGYITADELGQAMMAIGQNPSDEELADIIREVDQDQDGEINFSEFLEMMAVRLTKKEDKRDKGSPDRKEIKKAFKIFDRNGDGFITEAELRQTMRNLQADLTEEEVDKMIREADKDGDRDINYEEFVHLYLTKFK